MVNARFRALLIVVTAILNLWARSAAAETNPIAAFLAFGLFGTWSPDCKREPAADNPRVTWEAIDGVIVHTVTFNGRTPALVDFVGEAEIVGADLLRFTAIRDGKVALIVTIRRTVERVRTIRSETPDGHVYYDNEVELKTGLPGLTDEKCVAVVS